MTASPWTASTRAADIPRVPCTPEARLSTDLFSSSAEAFVRAYDPDVPFCVYIAFTAPHDPRAPPPEHRCNPEAVDRRNAHGGLKYRAVVRSCPESARDLKPRVERAGNDRRLRHGAGRIARWALSL
jgi:hypothetical protein